MVVSSAVSAESHSGHNSLSASIALASSTQLQQPSPPPSPLFLFSALFSQLSWEIQRSLKIQPSECFNHVVLRVSHCCSFILSHVGLVTRDPTPPIYSMSIANPTKWFLERRNLAWNSQDSQQTLENKF